MEEEHPAFFRGCFSRGAHPKKKKNESLPEEKYDSEGPRGKECSSNQRGEEKAESRLVAGKGGGGALPHRKGRFDKGDVEIAKKKSSIGQEPFGEGSPVSERKRSDLREGTRLSEKRKKSMRRA